MPAVNAIVASPLTGIRQPSDSLIVSHCYERVYFALCGPRAKDSILLVFFFIYIRDCTYEYIAQYLICTIYFVWKPVPFDAVLCTLLRSGKALQ